MAKTVVDLPRSQTFLSRRESVSSWSACILGDSGAISGGEKSQERKEGEFFSPEFLLARTFTCFTRPTNDPRMDCLRIEAPDGEARVVEK